MSLDQQLSTVFSTRIWMIRLKWSLRRTLPLKVMRGTSLSLKVTAATPTLMCQMMKSSTPPNTSQRWHSPRWSSTSRNIVIKRSPSTKKWIVSLFRGTRTPLAVGVRALGTYYNLGSSKNSTTALTLVSTSSSATHSRWSNFRKNSTGPSQSSSGKLKMITSLIPYLLIVRMFPSMMAQSPTNPPKGHHR